MSHDRLDYLWDRSGPIDDDVAELEDLLGELRYQRAMPAVATPRPLTGPPAQKQQALWWLMMAAGFVCVVLGWIVHAENRSGPTMAQLPTLKVPPVESAAGSGVAAGWRVSVLRGAPTCDGAPIDDAGNLPVGGWIETRDRDEARVAIGDIGEMKVGPNSRLRLLADDAKQMRIKLERGRIHAVVDAPPRVFLVDTPATTAVDLGCEYSLEVKKNGGVALSVVTGWVALEGRSKLATYVPAGFTAHTSPSGRAKLPWRSDAADSLIAHVHQYERDGDAALDGLLTALGQDDITTLWHLIVRSARRQLIYARSQALGAPSADDVAMLVAADTAALTAWGERLGVIPPPGWPNPPKVHDVTSPPDREPPVWAPAPSVSSDAKPAPQDSWSAPPPTRDDDG